MLTLLLFFTLPLIFIMSVATILLHLWLGYAIRRDVQDLFEELHEAYQEGRQKIARGISTPGGISYKECLDCKVFVYETDTDGRLRNEDGSFHVCE